MLVGSMLLKDPFRNRVCVVAPLLGTTFKDSLFPLGQKGRQTLVLHFQIS